MTLQYANRKVDFVIWFSSNSNTSIFFEQKLQYKYFFGAKTPIQVLQVIKIQISVADHPLRSATDHRFGKLLPHN